LYVDARRYLKYRKGYKVKRAETTEQNTKSNKADPTNYYR